MFFKQQRIQFLVGSFFATNVVRGIFLLAFVLTLWGCTPVIYVQPTGTMSFQETLEADAIIGARTKAHALSPYARTDNPGKFGVYLEPAKLPEAYTLDGMEGTRASQYHLGYAAIRLIRAHYADAYPMKTVPDNDDVEAILKAAGGNVSGVIEENRDWRIDIADVDRRVVFEVMPPGQTHQATGEHRANLHLMLLKAGMWGQTEFKLGTGYSGQIGVRFAEKTPPWRLSFQTVQPGVVQYRWQVLTVQRATHEAHQLAYVEDQWHEPTPNEIVKSGQALHVVVERLVQVRERLGRTQAREEMPVLPGQTMGDYLRALSLWSAHDERIARLLPIMREPPPPLVVRRDARFLGETLADGSAPKMHPGATTPDGQVLPPHPSAPEAYTMDGTFGRMPFEYFLGYSAHRAIAFRYAAYHGQSGHTVYKNFISIGTIVQETGGKKDLLPWAEADLRPDITHIRPVNEQFVFEIKPEGAVHLAKGKEKLAQYIAALNLGMVETPKVFVPGPNESGELYIMFKRGTRVWRLSWRSTAPGLIQYKWDRPNTKLDEEDERLRNEAWRDAVKNGRWTDISRQEMADDGEDLYTDLEGMISRRDVLGLFRDAVTIAVEGVGIAAEAVLSARLWNHIDKAPRIVPIVRAPAPGPQPIPMSKPIPPVNARSLGSDKRMAPSTARPGTPGKTPSAPRTAN